MSRTPVAARGEPAAGGWPHAVVTLDGRPLGELTAATRAWRDYRLDVELPAGRHVLRLTYDNDLQDTQAHEDRNLYLQQVVIERSKGATE